MSEPEWIAVDRSLGARVVGLSSEPRGIAALNEPNAAGVSHIYYYENWISSVSGLSLETVWWLSAIADAESPLASAFVDDQASSYERFRVSLAETCGIAETPSINHLAEAIPYGGGPDRYWRQSNGFGLSAVSTAGSLPVGLLADLGGSVDTCIAGVRSDIYPRLSGFMEDPGVFFVDTVEEVPLLDQQRGPRWAECLGEIGVVASQIGDLLSASQAVRGLTHVGRVPAIGETEAVDYEIQMALADWTCSKEARQRSRSQLFEDQLMTLART